MNSASISQRPPNRRAFSLIEMMVVITLSALLLGVATSMMFGLRQWDRRTREGGVQSEQLFRLAEKLRHDVRQGSDVLLSIDGPLVVMSPTGEQSRYELTPEGCLRSSAEPGEMEPRRDLFTIGPSTRWQVERLATGRRPLVSVTLEQPTEENSTRTAPLLLHAALGADVLHPAAEE